MKTLFEYLVNNHVSGTKKSGNIDKITKYYVDTKKHGAKYVEQNLDKDVLAETLKIQLGIDNYNFGYTYFNVYIEIQDMVDNNVMFDSHNVIELVKIIFAEFLKNANIDTITLYAPPKYSTEKNDNLFTHISFAHYSQNNGGWKYCYYDDILEPLKSICERLNKDIIYENY